MGRDEKRATPPDENGDEDDKMDAEGTQNKSRERQPAGVEGIDEGWEDPRLRWYGHCREEKNTTA